MTTDAREKLIAAPLSGEELAEARQALACQDLLKTADAQPNALAILQAIALRLSATIAERDRRIATLSQPTAPSPGWRPSREQLEAAYDIVRSLPVEDPLSRKAWVNHMMLALSPPPEATPAPQADDMALARKKTGDVIMKWLGRPFPSTYSEGVAWLDQYVDEVLAVRASAAAGFRRPAKGGVAEGQKTRPGCCTGQVYTCPRRMDCKYPECTATPKDSSNAS